MKENLDEIKTREHRGAILNYGVPMTGKTRSLTTLIPLGLVPIWYFDADDNYEPFFRRAIQLGAKGDDIVRFSYLPSGGDKISTSQYRPKGQGQDVFMKMMTDLNQMYDLLDAKGEWKPDVKIRVPKVVVFDSLTGWQEIFLDFVLAMLGQDLGAKGTDARDQYGKQMAKTVEIVNSVKGLPVLSIFNAHQKDITSESGSVIRIDPYVTGNISASFGKHFKAVLYSVVEGPPNARRFYWKIKPDGLMQQAGIRFFETTETKIDQDYALVLK
jgi:hypothetical protein